MLRILLFLGTNLAVIIVASITFQLLGLDRFLAAQGLDTNLTGLLIFCAIFGFGGAFVSLLLSKTMAKWSTGTRIIQQPGTAKEQWLVRTVEELARDAGIRTPEVGIFPSHASNAFATGWNKNSALVAVSEGLLARFGEREARAVLGHEISHVANGDMVTLTLIQGILNTFVIFFARIIGSVVDKAVFKNERGYGIGYFVVSIAAEIVLGILASMVVMWFSRFREFRADAGGARLAGRQSMIDALNRLRHEQGMPGEMPETLQAFGIRTSIKHGFTKLFSSHPPLELRIQALQRGG